MVKAVPRADLDQIVRDTKSRIDLAQTRRARALVEREQAEAALARAREALRTEFGVETPDQAREVMAKLDAEVETALAEARAKLDACR
jgi:adenylyl- and sulfurtransferase ThiI